MFPVNLPQTHFYIELFKSIPMSLTICIAANTLYYPNGGGHLWAYLNWARGFRSNGCKVIWLERIDPLTPPAQVQQMILALKSKLMTYGLSEDIALWSADNNSIPKENLYGCFDVDTAAEISDLILNQYYAMPFHTLAKFKRRALLDIDPGLLQMWWSRKLIDVVPHDVYFTIGETVGQPEARFPDCGVHWKYSPPCVSLEDWPVSSSSKNAPFTTITHWYMDLWEEENGKFYKNDKCDGFAPYFELPKHVSVPLELALLLGPGDEKDKQTLLKNGWHLCDSHAVAATPADYQRYIQLSRGEFSCVKPSCIRLQNAWISDRTINYLSSGKPCMVQFTGKSKFLPDANGIIRFNSMNEAIKGLEDVASNYEKHALTARLLAEEYFDAKKVTKSVLERAF